LFKKFYRLSARAFALLLGVQDKTKVKDSRQVKKKNKKNKRKKNRV
jgi:hypothetical protein